MLTFIILLLFIYLGYRLLESYNYDVLGTVILFLSLIFIVIHTLAISFKSYNYNVFVEKGKALEFSIKYNRDNDMNIESAAILKEVVKHNQELSKLKLDRRTFFKKQYIDSRVNDLKYIK